MQRLHLITWSLFKRTSNLRDWNHLLWRRECSNFRTTSADCRIGDNFSWVRRSLASRIDIDRSVRRLPREAGRGLIGELLRCLRTFQHPGCIIKSLSRSIHIQMRRRATDRTERATKYEPHRTAAQRGRDDPSCTLVSRHLRIVDSVSCRCDAGLCTSLLSRSGTARREHALDSVPGKTALSKLLQRRWHETHYRGLGHREPGSTRRTTLRERTALLLILDVATEHRRERSDTSASEPTKCRLRSKRRATDHRRGARDRLGDVIGEACRRLEHALSFEIGSTRSLCSLIPAPRTSSTERLKTRQPSQRADALNSSREIAADTKRP